MAIVWKLLDENLTAGGVFHDSMHCHGLVYIPMWVLVLVLACTRHCTSAGCAYKQFATGMASSVQGLLQTELNWLVGS